MGGSGRALYYNKMIDSRSPFNPVRPPPSSLARRFRQQHASALGSTPDFGESWSKNAGLRQGARSNIGDGGGGDGRGDGGGGGGSGTQLAPLWSQWVFLFFGPAGALAFGIAQFLQNGRCRVCTLQVLGHSGSNGGVSSPAPWWSVVVAAAWWSANATSVVVVAPL